MPRRAFDFYETPPHYLAALLDVVGRLPRHGSARSLPAVYDCCSGRDAIADPLRAIGVRVRTNDLDPRRPAHRHENAAVNGVAWGALGIPWVITNPPFSAWVPIMRQALRWHHNVAMLARLSIWEPTEIRRRFWRRWAREPWEVIVLPRYSFRRNDRGRKATDAITCCWVMRRAQPAAQRVTVSTRTADDVIDWDQYVVEGRGR